MTKPETSTARELRVTTKRWSGACGAARRRSQLRPKRSIGGLVRDLAEGAEQRRRDVAVGDEAVVVAGGETGRDDEAGDVD